MWQALKAALIATLITGAICASVVASYAQEMPPLRLQAVTWFCHTAERVDELMKSPGRMFTYGLMLSIARKECGFGLMGSTFPFMPSELALRGTSSEGEKYVVLKGQLFPQIEGGIEAFAPFDGEGFDASGDEQGGAELVPGQDT